MNALQELRRTASILFLASALQSCLALNPSPFDSSNGGYAGALLAILAAQSSRFVAFTSISVIYESQDGISWAARSITGASSISDAALTGSTLFGLDSGTNNLRSSMDGGRTWSSVSVANVTLGKVAACGMSVVASTSGAASYTAYYSTNTGTSFSSSVIDGSSAIIPRNMLCSDSQHFVSASNTGANNVSVSSNGGASWSASSGSLSGTYIGLRQSSARVISTYPATNPYVALSTDYGTSFGGADSSTLSSLTNGAIQGAMADDGTRFQMGFFNASTCHFYRSLTGANSTWTSSSVACPSSGSLVTLASGSTVLTAGGGSTAPLIVYSLDSGASWTVAAVPAQSGVTGIRKIVYIP